jgi:ABC-2 type transport system ATP-binding protein
MEAIRTSELTKVYKGIGFKPRTSLDRLSLAIHEGEVFGFLGRNGAGKTTTIKLLTGLLRATHGHAQLFGEDIRGPAARRLVGYLPEQPYFYEYLTPRETLDFYGRLRGLDAAARRRRWEELAAALDLRDIADQRIKGFSKGMRQRVGFAVALVGDPPLLILDEPMSGLDPVGRRTIRELILRLRDMGKTIFFSSHVLGDVEQICHRVGILAQGRLVKQGKIEDLLSSQMNRTEILASGLDAAAQAVLDAMAVAHRRLDGRGLWVFEDVERANEAAAEILRRGGRLLEFSPVKARLEDYFMDTVSRAEDSTQRVAG